MHLFYRYFNIQEIILWILSVVGITISFFMFDTGNPMALVASLVGVTGIIFNARGNPAGQALMILFSVLYGIISYTFSYYGEMITYVGMTGPMACIALITWLRNPYKGNKAQVAVAILGKREYILTFILAIPVTVIFYFILAYFDTANLITSTLSVATSFIAVYLTYRRSEYFSLAYAANDIVLVVLWTLAAVEDSSYIAVVVCFIAFLANDIYALIAWRKMRILQENDGNKSLEKDAYFAGKR